MAFLSWHFITKQRLAFDQHNFITMPSEVWSSIAALLLAMALNQAFQEWAPLRFRPLWTYRGHGLVTVPYTLHIQASRFGPLMRLLMVSQIMLNTIKKRSRRSRVFDYQNPNSQRLYWEIHFDLFCRFVSLSIKSYIWNPGLWFYLRLKSECPLPGLCRLIRTLTGDTLRVRLDVERQSCGL
jgi:hypothetical protein